MTDGAGKYSNGESCRVVALRPLSVSTLQYDVEGSNYDYLTVAGKQFKTANSGPKGVKMNKGDLLLWRTDGSGVREGWKVCATIATTTTSKFSLFSLSSHFSPLASPFICAVHSLSVPLG